MADGRWRMAKTKTASAIRHPPSAIQSMNISEIFIRRPVMTTLIMIAILLFGVMAYRQLPVSDLPNVDFPTIQVNAGLPGASPETMASAVATPLERQFSTIAGLDSMTSASSLGSTSITLQFNLSRDIDAAAQDAHSALAAAPAQLPTRGVGIDEVVSAIRASNVNLPTGVLNTPHQAATIVANGQLLNADDYRPITVAYRNGAPIRLNDLGRVFDSVENDKTAAWFRGKRGLILAVQKQPGTNVVQVSDSIRALLPKFRQELPASVTLDIHRDRAESIRESVNDVKFTLLLTLFLVILVIFLFLRNVSATVIPSLALPMSIVGTFAVMYLLDYSLDNLSLMALTLSVGFVVDDAIVMLENIVRHMERGEKPFQAALRGSKEIGFTILSMTVSLAAVFIPILFMGGILGRLFHEFAVTIGASILVSGFVSLTLTPMLAARFIRPHHGRHNKLYEATEMFFEKMLAVYAAGLRFVLRHKFATLMASLAILIATGFLFVKIPKGFLPSEDQGQILIQIEAAQGISFNEMVRHQLEVMDVVAKDPNVATYFSAIRGANSGIVSMRLIPRKERKYSADELITQMRPKVSRIAGIRASLQNPPPIRLGGRSSQGLYQYTMQGPDTQVLYDSSTKMLDKMRALPGFVDVTTDLQIRNPQVSVDIDRDRAASYGLTAQQVEDALFSACATRQVSTIYAPTNSYQVVMEVDPKYQMDPSELALLYVRAGSGELVPLSAFAKVTATVGPLTVNHSGQTPSVTISFNLKPGVSLGDAVNQINQAARSTLPASITTSFQGTAQAFQSSMQGLGLLLIMAIAVIYMVLGILYESFIHPLTILSALPFAGFGALLTLLVFKVDLSIYAFVGVIMLVGLLFSQMLTLYVTPVFYVYMDKLQKKEHVEEEVAEEVPEEVAGIVTR